MGNLQTKLIEAATQGSISSLQRLLKEDPLILDRPVNCFNETALHVAAMLGHVDFVTEIVRLKPHLVNELNSQQSSPLHLASAKGQVDVVRVLLSIDKRACSIPDMNGFTPLHLAAAKGQVEVMKLLLEAQPEAARLKIYGGEMNILHLCIKCFQLEALKLLLKAVGEVPEFINSKDDEGNTILHLAVADKHVQTIKYLVSVSGVEVDALNNEGMTAMDILIRSTRDVRDSAIEKSLKPKAPAVSRNQNINNGWVEKHKSALMVVGIFIAIQMGVLNASSIWQEDDLASSDPILAHKSLKLGFRRVYVANATSFVASLSIIILLLTSVLPLTRRFFMWILNLITRIAFTVALCYVFVRIMLRLNSYHQQTVFVEVVYTVIVWLILMLLLAIRMTVKLVKLGWTSLAA